MCRRSYSMESVLLEITIKPNPDEEAERTKSRVSKRDPEKGISQRGTGGEAESATRAPDSRARFPRSQRSQSRMGEPKRELPADARELLGNHHRASSHEHNASGAGAGKEAELIPHSSRRILPNVPFIGSSVVPNKIICWFFF
jgi:hypothetical protein